MGTEEETMEKCYLLGCSLWLGQFAFLHIPGPPGKGCHHPKWPGPFHISHQLRKCPRNLAYSNLTWVFSQLRFLPLRWFQLGSSWQKTSKRRWYNWHPSTSLKALPGVLAYPYNLSTWKLRQEDQCSSQPGLHGKTLSTCSFVVFLCNFFLWAFDFSLENGISKKTHTHKCKKLKFQSV